MKKITVTSAALFAVIGLSRVALADGGSQFTPVENLSPEQRQQVFEKISEMTKGAEPDWDKVVAGINGDGQAVLMQKSDVELASNGSPSCTGREKAAAESEK